MIFYTMKAAASRGFWGSTDLARTLMKSKSRGWYARIAGGAVSLRSFNREAVLECKTRGANRLLFISERRSPSGIAFLNALGLPYSFSEYRMVCHALPQTTAVNASVQIRPVTEEDVPFIKALDALCFGSADPDEDGLARRPFYLATMEGKAVGKVGLQYEDGNGYIFGRRRPA